MSYQDLYQGLTKTASYEEIATLATMFKQASLIKEEKRGLKIKGNILKNKQKQISQLIRKGRGGKGAEASNLVEHLQGNLKKQRPMFQNTSVEYPPALAGKMPLVAGRTASERAYRTGEVARKLLTEGKLVPGNLSPDKGQSVFSLRNA